MEHSEAPYIINGCQTCSYKLPTYATPGNSYSIGLCL